MKRMMSSLRTAGIILGLALLAPQHLRAQEWSAAQKEVWKTEQAIWEHDAARDLEKVMAYVHEDYLGWYSQDLFPMTKAEVRKVVDHDYKSTKVLHWSIRPLGIKIHGNVAFVHYYYQQLTKDAEGKEKTGRGRSTDILIKEEGKWLLVGGHGGPENTEKE